MALAYSVKKRLAMGNVRARIVEITTDTDYPAAGYSLDAESCGLYSTIDGLVLVGEVAEALGYFPKFTHGTQKLKFFEAGADGGDLDEVTQGENNLADVVWRFLAIEVFNG